MAAIHWRKWPTSNTWKQPCQKRAPGLHMDCYSHGNNDQTGKKMKKQKIQTLQMAGHIHVPLQE